ncbi:hypothetical protein U5817_09870 [Aromatoleum evansii]|uniref:HTH cro/C1-type domain-containing protein n=1 Tax=Aromatoleum evansii TaxID=59406 RepID=A0ABZ1AR28_AROEV|nr:hypothetical protein U5817_09520 [Aromatoleum evansii]WRL48333.1 hypothetical protein U5817_09870 [Aromatoleum evansii]
MQREMPMMAAARRPKEVEPKLLEMCRHRLDAIRLCIQLSGLSHETIAEELGLDKGHLCRILQGKAYFPDTRTIKLMELCGNIAPMQWEAQAMGYQLSADSKAQRKAELMAELAALEAA